MNHRRWRPAFIVLIMLAPMAAAEGFLQDPSGDVAAQAGGVPTSPPLGSDTVDLLGLDVEEDVMSIRFTLSLVSTAAGDQVGESHRISMRHRDQEYTLVFTRDPGAAAYAAYLAARQDGKDYSVIMSEYEVDQDDAAGTLAADVPRHHLVDRNGAAPNIGRALEDVEAISFGTSVLLVSAGANDPGVQIRDEMTGAQGPVTVPMRYGVEQYGDARLLTDLPFRTSNGAATTFVYPIMASNLADEEQVFSFDMVDVPDHWAVTVPFDTVAIGPGDTIEVPVVVQSPFAHSHGSRQTFVVEMHSQTDPESIGRVELGVQYPKVPQPAGHHDTVWFHSIEGERQATESWLLGLGAGEGRDFARAYLNALEDDDRDDAVPTLASRADREMFSDAVPPFADRFQWTLYLEPELLMGLLLDADSTGQIEVPLRTQAPSLGAWAEGHLVWFGPNTDPGGFDEVREERILARFASGPFSMEAGKTTPVTATINATDVLEVAFTPGARLALRIGLALDRPANLLGPQVEQPELLPGGWARLPLLEYEDPLDDVLIDQAIDYTVDASTRTINPGGTAVYHVHAASDVNVAILGSNRAWARIVQDGTQIDVAVTAPRDAIDEDRADLVLQLSDDQGGRAFVRLVTVVDTDALHPDDAALLAEAPKKAPGFEITALALGLLAIALLLRRRA